MADNEERPSLWSVAILGMLRGLLGSTNSAATVEREPLSPWTKAILELIQGLLPAMTAIGAGVWVAYTYFDHQKEIRRAQEIRAAREDTTRLLEAQKPFNQLQLKLYVDTSQVVGRIASADQLYFGTEDWKKDVRRFESLYWSELSMVEDENVKQAMINFRPKLREVIKSNSFDEVNRDSIQREAYYLAKALNTSISSTWVVALSEVTETNHKLCIGEPACAKGLENLNCGESVDSWAKKQQCLRYSVERDTIRSSGKCGYELADVKCTKRKQ